MSTVEYKYKDGLLEKGFYKAKELLKEGNRNEARDILDACIAIVAEVKYTNGKGEEDELEGVTIGVWLKRFWNMLENNGLLL
jgi:hypothetical protein